MKIVSNGKTIEVGGGSGGVTMDQVNTAIDTKLDAYTPLEVYSTEETRIGTWIDGKPVYRWCGRYTITANNNNYHVGNLTDRDTIIRSYGGYNNKSNGQFYAIPRNDTTGSINMAAIGNTIYSYVSIASNVWDAVNGAEAIVFVEYTKTTDQATVELPATLTNRRDDALAMDTASLPTAAVTAAPVEFESEEV